MKGPFFLAAQLSIAASSSFADALLFTVNATPYDNQMAQIRRVMTTPSHFCEPRLLNIVNRWMKTFARSPTVSPRCGKLLRPQSGAPADCKAKAVALYEKMQANGATNVRLVIGKRTSSSRQTHAWLVWDTQDGSYILDPTFNWAACSALQAGKRNYQPLYAYTGKKKFRAASTLVAQN